MAAALKPGDCILLAGPMGAGKSHLARAILRARLGDPDAEVPSPTYTLLNVYDDGVTQIFHGDLYRIASQDDIWELGLEEHIADAITLLEWPERWASPPERCLWIEISPGGESSRVLRFQAWGSGWDGLRHQLEQFRAT